MSLIWKKLVHDEGAGNLGLTAGTRSIHSKVIRMLDTASVVASEGVSLSGLNGSFSTTSWTLVPADAYLNAVKVTITPAPGVGKWYRFEVRSRGWTNTDADGISTMVIMSGKISGTSTSLDSRDIEIDATPSTLTDTMYPKGVFLPQGSQYQLLFYPSDAGVTPFTDITIEYDLRPANPDHYFLSHGTQTEGTFVGEEYQIAFATNTNTSSAGNATRYNHAFPVSGTISNWLCRRTSPYNTAGNEINMTLYNFTTGNTLTLDQKSDNELVDDTVLSQRIYGNLSGTLKFNDGDLVRYSHQETGTASARAVTHAFVFVPDTANEVPYFFTSSTVIPAADNNYYKYPFEVGTSTTENWTTTQADREIPWPSDETIDNVRCTLSATPGVVLTVSIKRVLGGSITLTFDGTSTEEDLVSTLTFAKGEMGVIEVDSNVGIGSVYIETLTFRGTVDVTADRVVAFSRLAIDTVLGAMTDTSFKVSAQLNQGNLPSNLVVSTGLTEATFDAGIVGRSSTVRPFKVAYRRPIETDIWLWIAEYAITGLTAETDYTYAIETGGVIDYESMRPVKTYVTEDAEVGSTVTDSYIWGSCLELDAQPGAAYGEYPPLVSASAETNLKAWLCCGDFTYHNAISTNTKQSFPQGIACYMFNMRACSDINRFISRYNFSLTPSDHDVIFSDGNNDQTGAGLSVPAGYNVINNLHPYYDRPAGSSTFVQAVSQTFKDGKVTFVVLDSQAQRHPEKASGTGIGTAFGDGRTTIEAASGSGNYTTWDQVTWFTDTAVAAKAAGCKLLICVLGGGKIEGSPATDTYQGDYLAEWQSICDFLCDPENDVPEVIFINGDNHTYGFDDGQFMNKFSSSQGQLACFRFAPMRRQQDEGSGSDTWNSVAHSASVTDQIGYGHIEVTKTVPAIHEYTYTITAKDTDGTQIGTGTVSKDATIKRLLDFAADKSNPVHPGVSGTISIDLAKTWLGAARFNLTAADGINLVKNTDYTITEGDQNTHANAHNPNIKITMLTTTAGKIDLTIADSTPADAGTTLTGDLTHEVTVGELALVNPDDLAGLVGWWDASVAADVTETANVITAWADKKGSANWAAAVGEEPTYVPESVNGKNAIDFDGAGDFMTATLAGTVSMPFTIVLFFRTDLLNDTNFAWLFGGKESTNTTFTNSFGRNRFSGADVNNLMCRDKGGTFRKGPVANIITGQQLTMASYTVNSATSQDVYSSIELVQDIGYPGPPAHAGGADLGTEITLGAEVSATNDFNGQFYEAMLYSRALFPLELNRLYNYSRARWEVMADPSVITGLLHWWDGDSGVSLDTSDVNTWTDSIGSLVLDATGSGTKRPTTTTQNGHTVLSFDRTLSQHMEVGITTAIEIPYTIAVFVQFAAAAQVNQWNYPLTFRDASANIGAIFRNRSNEDSGRLSTIDKAGTNRRSDSASFPAVPGSQYLMLLIKVTGTGTGNAEGVIGEPGTGVTHSITFTSPSAYAGGADIPSGGKIQVGSNNDGASTHMDGEVASIVVYDHELSVIETEQLYGYWHDRYIP